jgi:hypothetical protein
MPYTLKTQYGTELQFKDEVPVEKAQAYIQKRFPQIETPPEELERSFLTDTGASLQSGLGSLVEFPGNLYGLATGDFDNPFTRTGESIREGAEYSPATQVEMDELNRNLEELQGKGISEEVVGTLGELVSNPRLALQLGIEQIPNLIGGLGVGAVAKTGVKRLANEAAENTARKVGKLSKSDKAARAASISTFASMQGTDIGKSTYDEIMNLPNSTLAENSNEFSQLLNQGKTPRQAKEIIALGRGRLAGIKAAGTTLLTTALMPSSVEKIAFGGEPTGILKGIVKGAISEGTQEGLEEAGGALSQGYNVNVVDPSRDITQGLGVSGVLGTVLGGGMGAGVGAVSGLARGAPPPTDKEIQDDALLERERKLKEDTGQEDTGQEDAPEVKQLGYTPPIKQITDQTPKPDTLLGMPVEGVQKRRLSGEGQVIGEEKQTGLNSEQRAFLDEQKEAVSEEQRKQDLSTALETPAFLRSAEQRILVDGYNKKQKNRELRIQGVQDGDDKTNIDTGRSRTNVVVPDESRGDVSKQQTESSVGRASRLSDVDTQRRDNSGEPIGQTNPALDRIKQAYDELGEGNLQASLRAIAFDIGEDIKPGFYTKDKASKKVGGGQQELFDIDMLIDQADAISNNIQKPTSQLFGAKNAKALRASLPIKLQGKVDDYTQQYINRKEASEISQGRVRTDVKTEEEKPTTIDELQERTPLKIAQDNVKSELANLQNQLSNAQSEEEVNELNQKINNLTENKEALEISGQQQLNLAEEQQDAEESKNTLTAMSLAFKNAELEKQRNSDLGKMSAKAKSLNEQSQEADANGMSETIEKALQGKVKTENFVNKIAEMVKFTEYEQILNAIKPFLKTKDVSVQLVNTENGLGSSSAKGEIVYNPETGKSAIYLNSQSSDGPTGTNVETVLHELTHAATINRVHIGKVHTQQKIDSPQARAYQGLEKLLEGVRRHVTQEGKNSSADSLMKQMYDSRNNGYKNTPLENVDELIAYGFTNADFQSILNNIKIPDIGINIKKGGLGLRGEKGIVRDKKVKIEDSDVDVEVKETSAKLTKPTKGLVNAFNKFMEAITLALNLEVITRLRGTGKNKQVDVSALRYLMTETGSLLANKAPTKKELQDLKKLQGENNRKIAQTKIGQIFPDLLPLHADYNKIDPLEPVSRNMSILKKRKFKTIINDKGVARKQYIDGEDSVNTPNIGGLKTFLNNIFNPNTSFGDTATMLLNKFVNDRAFLEKWQEETKRAGKLVLSASGFNNVYSLLTTTMGRGDTRYQLDVQPLENSIHDSLKKMTKHFKDFDGSDFMKHLHNLLVAIHEPERRQIKFFRQVSFQNKMSGKRRTEIFDSIKLGLDIANNQKPLTKEDGARLMSELKKLVANDPTASKVDINNMKYDVSNLSSARVKEIIQANEEHMAKNPEFAQLFKEFQGDIKQLNDLTIKLNKEANYWSTPVDVAKEFYGWQNYVPYKGLVKEDGTFIEEDALDELFDFSSKRVSGNLKDKETGFQGRSTESDNVVVRALSEAAHSTLKISQMEFTQGLKNAVLDGSMKGEVKTFKFEEKENDSFKQYLSNNENSKGSKTIFNYNEDGSIDAITIEDKNLANSIKRTAKNMNPIFEYGNYITSKIGQLHTRYNINFPALNYIRDLLTNSFILGAEFSPAESYRLMSDVAQHTARGMKLTGQFAFHLNTGNYARAKKLASKYAKNKGDKEFLDNLIEYVSEGGRISYIRGLSTQNELQAIQSKIPLGDGLLSKTGLTAKNQARLRAAGEAINTGADIMMDTFELTARTLMYARVKKLIQEKNNRGKPDGYLTKQLQNTTNPQKRQEIQKKIDQSNLEFVPELATETDALKQEATAYVKNLANFEQSGEKGRAIGAMYMFYRPSMTGAMRSLKAIMQGEHGRHMAAVLMGMGAFAYAMAAAFSADDEEGRNSVLNDDLSRWSRNLRIHYGDEKVFQMPWGFGNGGLMAVGAQLMGLFMGNNSVAEVGENLIRISSESYMPLPISGMSPLDQGVTKPVLDSFLPSALRPIFQAVYNTNGLGYQIYPSSNSRYSDAYGFSPNIPQSFSSFAKELYDVAGIEVSPNTLYFFANSYFDGPARIMGMVDGMARVSIGDKEFNPKTDMPFLGSFASKPSNIDARKFGQLQDDMVSVQKKYNTYKNDPEKLRDYMGKNKDEIKAMFIYNRYKNGALNRVQQYENIVKRNTKLSSKEKEEKIKEIRKIKDGLKRRAVEQIEATLD